MKTLLKELLNRLEAIGAMHEELYDSDVRNRMSKAVLEGFLRLRPDYVLPQSFGMYSEEENEQVRSALEDFIRLARDESVRSGVNSFHRRLSALQDETVTSDTGHAHYDDFFGYRRAGDFDENGNVRLAE